LNYPTAQTLAAEQPSVIEKETLKKRITNIEQGITNIEVSYKRRRWTRVSSQIEKETTIDP
jgi:hypothetical protein